MNSPTPPSKRTKKPGWFTRLLRSDYRLLLIVAIFVALWVVEAVAAKDPLPMTGLVTDFDPQTEFLLAIDELGLKGKIIQSSRSTKLRGREQWIVQRFLVTVPSGELDERIIDDYQARVRNELLSHGCIPRPGSTVSGDQATGAFAYSFSRVVSRGLVNVRISIDDQNQATVIYQASEFPQ